MPRATSSAGPGRSPRGVLFLAYHFPPVGGAGVQRSVKFARYLPELGYLPHVVTGAGATGGRYTPTDETMAAEVAGVEVHRVPGAPAAPGAWRRRADRWLQRPTPWARWWTEGAVDAGRAVGDRADVVLATMSPWESGEAAARLSAELGIPWVADLRDPWALDEMQVYPTRLHRRRELARMRAVLASAEAIVMNTPEAAARLAALPGLGGKRVTSIPNGFDAEDFDGPAPAFDRSAFRIVHTGFLHTELGHSERSARTMRRLLGGALNGVDILTRSHVFLLEAVERLLAADPALASALEVHFAGVMSEGDLAAARSPVVRVHGYMPHSETVALMRGADLLFLPMHDLPPGVRATIVPGKTYEYLAAGAPILAAVPDGDARDLLASAGNTRLCRPADVAGMVAAIAAELARWRAGAAPARPDPAVLAAHERRQLTARLAEVLDSVVAAPTRPPAYGAP